MKLRKGLRIANALLLNVALLFGTCNAGAYAATTVQQIYSWPTIKSTTESEKVIVTKGVTYQKIKYDTSSGPIVVHETWVDLDDPNVRVKTVMSGGKLENERNETVTGMAQRTGAVAGVNGDFFESQASGMALGMTIDEGKLIHTPSTSVVLGIDANNHVTIGKYSFSGAVKTANGQSFNLSSINGHPVSFKNGMVLITPELGFWEMASNATIVTLQKLDSPPNTYQVQSMIPAQNVVEAPSKGTVRLVAQGQAAIDYVVGNVIEGDQVEIAYQTNPDTSHLKYAIGGGTMLLKNGEGVKDPNSLGNIANTRGPLTGVGVTDDGTRMLQLAIDGRTKESIGVHAGQMTNYFLARGITNAMALDGGGSTAMTVRQPGETAATTANSPSDGRERAVANGVFVYSVSQPGKPTHVTVNGGAALSVFKGAPFTLSDTFVRDENYNPLPGEALTLRVEPPTLGSLNANGVFTAGDAAGTGKIIATASNGATGEVAVTVHEKVDKLTITPNVTDIQAGEQVSLNVTGTIQGWTVGMKPEYVQWKLNDPALGTLKDGVFTAAAGKQGTAQITATLGGASATATVGIGYVQKTFDPLDGTYEWVRSNRWGEVGTLSWTQEKVRDGKKASLAVNYQFPAGDGLKQFVFYPQETALFPAAGDNAAVNPVGVGVWVYGDNSGTKLLATFTDPEETTTYNAVNSYTVDWAGWKYLTFKAPSNANYPLKFSFFDLTAQSPKQELKGNVYLSNLQTLYAARTYQEKPPEPEKPTVVTFDDIQQHWGRTIIETLATRGVVAGVDKTHFAPDTGLTRAQAVALVVRSLKLQPVATDKFSDVNGDEWFAKEVGAAVEAGIVSGVGDGKFAPNAPVDRNQAAVMVYNALKLRDKTPTGGTPIKFTDAGKIALWAKDEVDALSAAGLLKGNGDGTLSPTKVTTRAEAAVMIHNMMKYAGLLS